MAGLDSNFSMNDMRQNSNGYNNLNGNNQNNNNPVYYSRYKWRNYEGNLDNRELTVSFSSGLLKMTINEFDNNNHNKLSEISISPTKALLLANELKKFKEDIKNGISDNNGYGINGGLKKSISYIMFTYKENLIYVTIGSFNSDSGDVESAYDFIFNSKTLHTSLEWSDSSQFNSLVKIANDFVELDQLIWLFEDFARFSSGAAGYTALDLNRYESYRMINKFDPIYDKLGIERYRGSSYNQQKNSNFLNSKITETGLGYSGSDSSSFEDLESSLDGD